MAKKLAADDIQYRYWLGSGRGRFKQFCHLQPDGWHHIVAVDDGQFEDKGLCSHDHSPIDPPSGCCCGRKDCAAEA